MRFEGLKMRVTRPSPTRVALQSLLESLRGLEMGVLQDTKVQ
jgi:hypothetical protein